MHNIYISITNTNLEAINFIELCFCVFVGFFLPPLLSLFVLQAAGSCPAQLIGKLLAAVRQEVSWGSEDNCFLKINIYFILLWYGSVSMETAGHFLSDVEPTGGGAAHHVWGVEILNNCCLCVQCCGCMYGCGGWKREKVDTQAESQSFQTSLMWVLSNVLKFSTEAHTNTCCILIQLLAHPQTQPIHNFLPVQTHLWVFSITWPLNPKINLIVLNEP